MAGIDIAAFLRGLGLAQYEPAFRDNDIDGEVLPSLTAEDLAGLGVTSIGHRRKLREAIAALRAETTAPVPGVPRRSRCRLHPPRPPSRPSGANSP